MAAKPVNPSAGQIWFIEEPRLGNSTHGHYVLVTWVNVSQNLASVNFIATASTSYDDHRIDSESPNFAATGLHHTSHLLRNEGHDIALDLLKKGEYRGFLAGAIKNEIEEWWGAKL